MSRIQKTVHAAGRAADLVSAIGPGAWIEADTVAASGRRFSQDLPSPSDRPNRDPIQGRAFAIDVGSNDEGGRGIVVQGWADFLNARGDGAAFEHAGGESPGSGTLLQLD